MDGLQVQLTHHLGELNLLAGAGYRKLWLCSAYLSRDGVTAIADLLAAAPTIESIFGAGHLTDPAALRSLQGYGSAIRLVPHDPGGAEFHPKCYLGRRRDGQAWAAVGSANLTGGGAGGNVELLATVTGPGDHPFFADLTDWLEEMRSCALPLTPDLLAAVEHMHAAHRATAREQAVGADPAAAREQLTGALSAGDAPLVTARELVQRLHRQVLLQYVRTTKVFASYKLVILGLLLRTRHGRLSLSECARRFHAFYLALAAAGQQPERGTGHPPPDMLHPQRLDQETVERLLLKKPRRAFHNTGRVVVFTGTPPGTEVAVPRPLWVATSPALRRVAFAAVVERLAAYYLRHTGTARAVRAALDAAAGEDLEADAEAHAETDTRAGAAEANAAEDRQ